MKSAGLTAGWLLLAVIPGRRFFKASGCRRWRHGDAAVPVGTAAGDGADVLDLPDLGFLVNLFSLGLRAQFAPFTSFRPFGQLRSLTHRSCTGNPPGYLPRTREAHIGQRKASCKCSIPDIFLTSADPIPAERSKFVPSGPGSRPSIFTEITSKRKEHSRRPRSP